MKLAIRRVGNSLGVIIPKAALDSLGVGEGDAIEISDRNIRPARRGGYSHKALDELKRSLALAVVDRFTPNQIRGQSLANLHRWKKQGVWGGDYEEWLHIIESKNDGELLAAMLGRDEDAVRLRQSMPFVGLLSQDEVKRLHEEATG